MSSPKRTVVIIQRVLPHYRVAFYTRLSQRLHKHGVLLRVIYGQEFPGTVPRSVHPGEDWAEFVKNHYWSIGGVQLVWQSCLRYLGSPDLIIIEQANRLLVNYPLLVHRALGRVRLAFWGHGRNLQSPNPFNFREKVKQGIMKAVDWWFAYTQLSAEIVSATGYSHERITVVENSIDTDEFEQAIKSVTHEQLRLVRERLGLGAGPVALYCGGMYPDKQVPFLLEAAERMRSNISNFNFILIGSGPHEDLVQKAAARHPWIHYVGAVYGLERAVYFSASDAMLMPGLVGLAIVDSFIAGLPMITTDIPIHSPEIAYLVNDVNGVMTAYSLDDYVAAAVDVLSNAKHLSRLREGCAESARRYTLNSMVDNFSAGIMCCLNDNTK